MLGLGAGAFAVRNLTILMVDRGTVAEYKYLEHGAMWSIGLLATSMIIQIFTHLPHGLIIAFCYYSNSYCIYSISKRKQIKWRKFYRTLNI